MKTLNEQLDTIFEYRRPPKKEFLMTVTNLGDLLESHKNMHIFETPEQIGKNEYRDFLDVFPEIGGAFKHDKKYFRVMECPCLVENPENWERGKCKIVFRALRTTKKIYEKIVAEQEERYNPIRYHGRRRNLSNYTG